MSRCIELAKCGLGATYPNPMVGSVIVYNDTIIGEGWHQKAGTPHAEVHAIASVKDLSLLEKATIYVSLEPCSHFGKTPPCADLIINHKIPRVVIGTVDPFTEVCGNGIQKLKAAGIEVVVGVLEAECKALNKRFFTYHLQKRPFVVLKWAQSADNLLAPKTKVTKAPVWISNPISRQLVHKWRSEEQAILIGAKTVLEDNPKLDVRNWTGKNPIRLVLDPNNSISGDYHVLDGSLTTWFFVNELPKKTNPKIVYHILDKRQDVILQILNRLYQESVQSLLVEGGAYTLQSFIESGYWDEARIFCGSNTLKDGTKAPEIKGEIVVRTNQTGDNLLIYHPYDTSNNF